MDVKTGMSIDCILQIAWVPAQFVLRAAPTTGSNRPVVEGMFRIIAQLELTEICCHAFLADAAECHEIASLHTRQMHAQEPVSISTSAGTNFTCGKGFADRQTQKLC